MCNITLNNYGFMNYYHYFEIKCSKKHLQHLSQLTAENNVFVNYIKEQKRFLCRLKMHYP